MKRATLVALIAGGVAVLLLVNLAIYVNVLRPAFATKIVVMNGPSMEPTYKQGDRLRMQAPSGDIQHGDVVLYTDPTNSSRLLVKRAVALAGDVVEIRAGVVYLNSKPLAEPYVNANWKGDMAPLRVPDGQVFILGDNRGMSFDSRHTGPVPLANVKAVLPSGK